jgi:hypothetical protein
LARVARLVDGATERSVEQLASDLIEIAPSSHRDDVAILVVRRTSH